MERQISSDPLRAHQTSCLEFAYSLALDASWESLHVYAEVRLAIGSLASAPKISFSDLDDYFFRLFLVLGS